MKWQEVRRLYPNQYVILEELESNIKENKKYIDDVAIIKSIDNPKEATRELVRSKGKKFVYHTAEESIVIEIVRSPGIRRVNSHEN